MSEFGAISLQEIIASNWWTEVPLLILTIHFFIFTKKRKMDMLEHGLIYKQESYKVIGACMEVHNVLGCGFLETVYQEALSIEFTKRGIPFEQEKLLEIDYKGTTLQKKYMADFYMLRQDYYRNKGFRQATS